MGVRVFFYLYLPIYMWKRRIFYSVHRILESPSTSAANQIEINMYTILSFGARSMLNPRYMYADPTSKTTPGQIMYVLWVCCTMGNWDVSMSDNNRHVETSTEGRKLSSLRHFKIRNGLCRLLFSTKQMLPCHT